MSEGEFRFRSRTIPYDGQHKTAGYQDPTLEVGKWDLKSVDTGKWVPMGSELVQTNTPYAVAESVYDQIHKGPPYNTGGPFTKIRIEFPPIQVLGNGVYHSAPTERAIWGVGTGPLRYTGGFTNPLFQGDSTSYVSLPYLLGATSPLIPSVSGWSPQAFAKTRPPLQKAGAAVFIAELRDLPRQLRTTSNIFHDLWKASGGSGNARFLAPKGAADHFLNHQFGWVPFISDMQKFSSTFQDAAAIKSRMTNENGKWIRRRATLLNDYQETLLASDSGMRVEPAGDYVSTLFNGTPRWEVWEKKASLITTSGSFRYYRPEFDDSLPDYGSVMSSIQRQLTIYGARLSPSNIYKAVPWTWAIDWFTDFGSVIDRFTDIYQDQIAAKYLFLMRHDYREVVLKQTLPFKSGGIVTLEFSRITDCKIRRESDSPYGFGLSWNGLTPRQLAILAALKISRT